jgi:hypothetical protein
VVVSEVAAAGDDLTGDARLVTNFKALAALTVESIKVKSMLYPRLSPVRGLIAVMLVGLLVVAPCDRKSSAKTNAESISSKSINLDNLSTEEIRDLVVRALSKLEEQQGLTTDPIASVSQDPKERGIVSWNDVEHGVGNIRRFLPSVQRWVLSSLREATNAFDIKSSDWARIDKLVLGVRRVVSREGLRGVAAVRDDRLSEVMVDPMFAPYLVSDDQAVFVLAHELTHVAARSNKLDRFIMGVAENVSRNAQVKPTEAQREDLACDFIGELVLKRYITHRPTGESPAARVSSVFGYESPAQRFSRAWDEFCAAYNGDPGDDDHLTQYQTIRALLALDPELISLMPKSARSLSPSCDARDNESDTN